MPGEDWKKDRETGDSEITLDKKRSDSPLGRALDMIDEGCAMGGTEGFAKILAAGKVLEGILRGIKDKDGNLVFYNAEVDSAEEKRILKDDKKGIHRVNLYPVMDKLRKSHENSKVDVDFTTDKGLKGTCGSSYKIKYPKEYAEIGQKAIDREGDKLDLAGALDGLGPLLGYLGEHGLLEAYRPITIAGKIIEIERAESHDIEVYEILNKEFEIKWATREKELEDNIRKEFKDAGK